MQLLEDYELAVNMFDNMDWYIVPSLNVDGYTYTWTSVSMSDRRVWLPLDIKFGVSAWFIIYVTIVMPLVPVIRLL